MDEKEYREIVKKAFERIVKSLDNVDPDLAEVDYSQGAVTILFKDRTKLILSQQPSVRQIWVANAARGVAHHLNYDAQSCLWIDDKGKGVELNSYLEKAISEVTGLDVKLS